jgi:hypothetical protein
MQVIIFAVIFGVTLFLQRWLQQHIQGFTFAVTGNPGCAVRALFFLLLPGVLLHEFSHWLIANLLNVRTGAVNIGLRGTRGKNFSLGSVTVERSDPVRESLIGIAPFVSGLLAIWGIMGFGFDLWPNSPLSPEIVWERVGGTLGDPLTWLALYLVFAVSTSMIPSESDREPWGVIILFFAAVTLGALFFGWTPSFSPEVIGGARQVLDALTFAFGLIAIVNGSLAVLIALIEWAFGHMTQRRVRY